MKPVLYLWYEHSALFQCMIANREPRNISYWPLQVVPSGNILLKDYKKSPATGSPPSLVENGEKNYHWFGNINEQSLEVIEASWLFGIPIERIRVVIHPQSIIHSMLEFMTVRWKPRCRILTCVFLSSTLYSNPSAYQILTCRSWNGTSSKNWPSNNLIMIDSRAWSGNRCRQIRRHIPHRLCAADEVAVQLFLDQKIGFTDIARLVAESSGETRVAAGTRYWRYPAAYEETCNYTLELAGKKI